MKPFDFIVLGSGIAGLSFALKVAARGTEHPLSQTGAGRYTASMSEIIFQVTEDETDGGFIARALGHSIVTEADTWDELRAHVREAVRCHFDEGKAPAVIQCGVVKR